LDPDGHTFTSIAINGYDVYRLAISNDDDIEFYAVRLSDGKEVVAEIDNMATIKVLKEK
jgi:hypothetical protein